MAGLRRDRQPGNPELTEELTGRSLTELAEHCDRVRAAQPLDVPHLLDDMAVLATRARSWSCQSWWNYCLPCPHGGAYMARICPAAKAA